MFHFSVSKTDDIRTHEGGKAEALVLVGQTGLGGGLVEYISSGRASKWYAQKGLFLHRVRFSLPYVLYHINPRIPLLRYHPNSTDLSETNLK